MKETLEVLNRMQADGIIGGYAIGGAVGATLYLEPSATLDVDVFVTLPPARLDCTPIHEYLTARGGEVQGEHIVVGGWPVQFRVPSDNLEREALAYSIEVDVEDGWARVMTPEHLVALALKSGRPEDFSRILQFVEQDAVDMDLLKRIVSSHGVERKWQKFRQRYLGGVRSNSPTSRRKELAKLPFSEKLKILAKLRDRSLAIAGARRKKAEAKRKG